MLIRRENEAENGKPVMMAIMTVDRNRNYYVSTRSSTTPKPVSRIRWTQPKNDKAADAVREEITFTRPEAVDMYHSFASIIDQHNGSRQEMLALETTWKTQSWHLRCNMTVIGISIVDSMLVYEQATHSKMKQRKYFAKLAEQLIDNNWDEAYGMLYDTSGAGKDRVSLPTIANDSLQQEANSKEKLAATRPHGIGIHLTPVKEKNPNTGFTWQHRCNFPGCRRQVTLECSVCFDLFKRNEGHRFFCCRPDKSNHWNKHMEEYHGACLRTIKDDEIEA